MFFDILTTVAIVAGFHIDHQLTNTTQRGHISADQICNSNKCSVLTKSVKKNFKVKEITSVTP